MKYNILNVEWVSEWCDNSKYKQNTCMEYLLADQSIVTIWKRKQQQQRFTKTFLRSFVSFVIGHTEIFITNIALVVYRRVIKLNELIIVFHR